MPDCSRVLCAIDFSEASRRVLDCALWWARRHGADVSVLHVHAIPIPTSDEGSNPLPPSQTLTPEEHSAHQLEVERFVEQARTDGVQIEVLLDEDVSIADAVVARADALSADLVVVGAGTNPASEHPSLGAITAAVLRGAPCSVLVIPAPAADVVNPCVTGIRKVMCAVSLSEQSRPVLDAAVALAAEDAAHLSVVHVVELSEVAALAYDFDAHREARLQPACEDLVALVASAAGDKPVEEIVAQGTASHEVLKLAAEESTDLIVVGTGATPRPPGGRPTAQAVAREARCPVLFVHAEPVTEALLREPIPSASTDYVR
jgi:nucleotide-binding universal stress UspA family protein